MKILCQSFLLQQFKLIICEKLEALLYFLGKRETVNVMEEIQMCCTKNSIPFSQFLRLRRLCSDDADFEEKTEEMANFFLQKWYPENTVKKL